MYFDVGSAALYKEAARELGPDCGNGEGPQGLPHRRGGLRRLLGNVATTNQKLSLDRSQAVVNWLAQQGGIPFVHMLAPGAMSTAQPAASNETNAGRAQNRRVVVKVLVNRGIAEP